MATKARIEQSKRALAVARAARHALSPPVLPPPSESTRLRATQDALDTVQGRFTRACRNARKKLDLRNQKLKDNQLQQQDITHCYTTALQDIADMQTQIDGLIARNEVLCLAVERKEGLLDAAQSDLLRTQHALKMTKSDLDQAAACDALKAIRLTELTREVRTLRARAKRAHSEPSSHNKLPLHVFKVKEHGEIPLAVRVAVLRLVALGIGIKHIFPVIQCLARLFEVALKGQLSPASIQNIIHEGGVAAHLQVAEAMRGAKSMFLWCNFRALVVLNIIYNRWDYQQ
jgi:hypothetical protein